MNSTAKTVEELLIVPLRRRFIRTWVDWIVFIVHDVEINTTERRK